jgi:class 3 adenylate cyclase
LRALLTQADVRVQHLEERLEELGPRIEGSKAKSDFFAEQHHSRLGDYLNEPENARRLFDEDWSCDAGAAGHQDAARIRAQLLGNWVARLEQRGLLLHVVASYELRNIYHDYCPPIHLQQLKKALVSREEFERVAGILKQFPARQYSLERIEVLSKKLRRYPREETRAVALRFAEDFMRLRRDRRNYERLTAAMERIQLVRSERTRELSRLNNSLYEFLLPSEARPVQDNVVSHAVIKADVRGSTRITQDLLARGLNPATLFSLNFYEPVKRILGQYGAAKVFIEGDAMVLAIFETESNRSHQRAVSKACALSRQILAIASAYNERPEAAGLPRLELGVGVAFQGSAPTYWVDSDSRIMISRALNLSDRLSSCSRAARRILGDKTSLFHLFVFQPGMTGPEEEEADEFLIRFNLNGIELNEEGFTKLREEISLHCVETDCEMPWGREPATFYFGEAPIGEGLEPILLRRGLVRQMLPDGTIGAAGQRAYYEVCTEPKLFELVEALLVATSSHES